MKKLLCALLLAAVQLPASAAGNSTGTVSYLFVHDPGVLMFAAGTQTTPIACSTQGQWAVDLSTTMGKNIYAMLLSAQSQGQTVTVAGSGVCSAWGDREKPLYVYVQP